MGGGFSEVGHLWQGNRRWPTFPPKITICKQIKKPTSDMVIRGGLQWNSDGQLKLDFATQTLTRLIKTTLFLFVFYELSFLKFFLDFSHETQKCNILVRQTSFLNACIQTFVHNSFLLNGLEFNCTARDFLCPSHWLRIDFNVIQNCLQKFRFRFQFHSLWISLYHELIHHSTNTFSLFLCYELQVHVFSRLFSFFLWNIGM